MKEVNRNILDYCQDNNVIIHGCNAFGVMGAGVAKTLSGKYTAILEHDRKAPHTGHPDKVGTINYFPMDIYEEGAEFTVVNACTQYRDGNEIELFGYKTQKAFRKNAIRECFAEIKKAFGGYDLHFVMPKIGAGLAGGNWEDISKIIEQEMVDENITVINYKY